MAQPPALDVIHNCDCIAGMKAIPPGSVDLAFADPPFNIGYEYDVYEDRRAAEEYLRDGGAGTAPGAMNRMSCLRDAPGGGGAPKTSAYVTSNSAIWTPLSAAPLSN